MRRLGSARLVALAAFLLALDLRAAEKKPAPAPLFDVTLDKTAVALGDRVLVTYSARIPRGAALELDALVSPKLAPDAERTPVPSDAKRESPSESPGDKGPVLEFETPAPASLKTVKTADGQELVEWTRTFPFAAFVAGAIPIPGPRLVYTTPDGEKLNVRPPSVTLQVSSRLPGDQSPEALRPKADRGIYIPSRGFWFWASLVLGAALLAVLIWALARRRPKVETTKTAEEPPIAPSPEFLAALAQLSREAELLGDDPREFYSRLTHAAKRYMERRLSLPILESTTLETVRFLRESGIDFPSEIAPGELFGAADHVKFGKGASTRDEARRYLARARNIHDHLERRQAEIEARQAALAAQADAKTAQVPSQIAPSGHAGAAPARLGPAPSQASSARNPSS